MLCIVIPWDDPDDRKYSYVSIVFKMDMQNKILFVKFDVKSI